MRPPAAHGLCSSYVANSPLTIEQALALLAAGPPRIAVLSTGLSPTQSRARPNVDGWSANDVLAHLRACADVWGDCIVAMIAEYRPMLVAVNPTTWINKTNYCELEFESSLLSFSAQRAELLAVLEALPREAWLRAATVTGAGAPLERTVLSYAQRLARHERQHLAQIERIVNTMHR